MLEPRNLKPTTNMFRLIVMITSLLSAGCLVMKHYYKVLWLNEHFHQETDTHIYVQYQEVLMDTQMHNLKKREKFFNFWIVIEVLVLLVCPIPYYDCYITIIAKKQIEVVYLLSEFIFAFMWLRVLFLVRAIFNYSVFTDAYSKKLCHTYGFTAGVRFAFKCQMIVDPEKTVFMLFCSTICILA